MGKRIISQARGKGSLSYRVRKRAYRYTVGYPIKEGKADIKKIIHSPAHSAPLIEYSIDGTVFHNVAFNNAVLGEAIKIGGNEIKEGNVLMLKDIPTGTRIFNIEKHPGDGGKMARAAGSSGVVHKVYDFNKIGVVMPNRNELILDGLCRASVGVVAGDGKKHKPFMKAGAMFYKAKSRNKLWPRTSAIKTNAIDHPFGSGRGKRAKPKIAKRNAPAGARVGHIRPRRTGARR